jgi:hypothetical protein
MNDALAQISARYSKFAEDEAHGKSPLYEELAGRVAADPGILAYLSELPGEKQQPNLLFAAVKYLHGWLMHERPADPDLVYKTRT